MFGCYPSAFCPALPWQRFLAAAVVEFLGESRVGARNVGPRPMCTKEFSTQIRFHAVAHTKVRLHLLRHTPRPTRTPFPVCALHGASTPISPWAVQRHR
jgi:hypothetical protein